MDLIQNKVSQFHIVSSSVEQNIVIQLVGDQHRRVGRLWVLYLHGPPKQQAFFFAVMFSNLRSSQSC